MEEFVIESYAEPVFGIQIPGPITLMVHDRSKCEGQTCGIHNPSDHPLKDAPRNWRSDKNVMERICEHGVGHDDVDGVAFAIERHRAEGKPEKYVEYIGTHGCDGCC